MTSTKKLKGLPNNLVQQFFSTMFYYDKGYMADWIWHTAKKNNVIVINIDIINERIDPVSIQIKPIISQLHILRGTINSELIGNNFQSDFIQKANLTIKILTNSKTQRFMEVKGIIVDKNDNILEGKIYHEEATEENFNQNILDKIKSIFG